MQLSDRERFSVLLADVLAFYGQEANPFSASVWWAACEAFSFEQVSRALSRHATDPERGQFPPKPADIVRQLQGTATDRSLVAWGKFFDAICRVGAYTDVVFDDPVIHAVVEDLGGWQKVCRSEMSELSYTQHRFTEAYKAYLQRGQFEYPRRLMGDRSPDDVYARRGLPPPKPAIIGDVVKAREVYRLGAKAGKTSVMYQALDAIEHGQPLIGQPTRAAA